MPAVVHEVNAAGWHWKNFIFPDKNPVSNWKFFSRGKRKLLKSLLLLSTWLHHCIS